MYGLARLPVDDGPSPLAMGALAVLAAALATSWVAVERRMASPMVDLRMPARPAVWHACVLTLVITTGFGTVSSLVPQMFGTPGDGYGFGADTTNIGLFLLPGATAGAVSDSVGGVMARRFGLRTVVVLGAVVTVATMIALVTLHTAEWQLVLAKALPAMARTPTPRHCSPAPPAPSRPRTTGIATSLLVVTRVTGVTLGVQLAAAILGSGAGSTTGMPTESAFVTGFTVAALVAAGALLVDRIIKKGAQA